MFDAENLLLTLANCGGLTSGHLHRLHFPAHKEKTVKNRLTLIKDQGLIQRREWTNQARIRQPALWSLTELGHRQIQGCAAYPGVGPQRAQVLARHDYRLTEMIVRIIELARLQGLSGIRVFREIKLNPDRRSRKPILDGLVIFETGGAVLPDASLIPWASPTTMPLDRDTLYRVALEADNETESAQVIADKAGNYQQVMREPAWHHSWAERFGGGVPLVLWVAPSSRRRDEIVHLWSQRWPDGWWAVADDAGLAANDWRYHAAGTTRSASLVFAAKTPVPVPAPLAPVPVPTPRPETHAERHERLVGQLATINAQQPLPLEELLALLGWDANFGGTFNAYGQPLDTAGDLWAWEDYQLGLAEQAIWLKYHEEMLAELARVKAKQAAQSQAAAAEKQRVQAEVAARVHRDVPEKASQAAAKQALAAEQKTWRTAQSLSPSGIVGHSAPPAPPPAYVQGDDGLWYSQFDQISSGIRTMDERVAAEERLRLVRRREAQKLAIHYAALILGASMLAVLLSALT